jgi:hypothetical protein
MASIIEDLEQGHPAIRLVDLPSQDFMPRTRKKDRHHRPRTRDMDKCAPFRWGKRGMETLKTPGGLITTKPAVLRFFAALSKRDKQQPAVAIRTPARRARDVARAESELKAAGIA